MTDETAERSGLAQVLAADAVWDGVLGVAFCAVPWLGRYAGLPAARPWPVFVLAGLACLAFAVVLARGARGPDATALCRVAAIGNAAAAVLASAAAVLLGGAPAVALGLAAAGCLAFAVAEWNVTARRR